MRRILRALLAALCCLTLPLAALADTGFVPGLADWDLDSIPLELTLSADVTAYAPFDEDRLPQLTSLMKHLSLRVTREPLIDETQSTIDLLVDGESALSLGLQKADQGGAFLQLSAMPEKVIPSPRCWASPGTRRFSGWTAPRALGLTRAGCC